MQDKDVFLVLDDRMAERAPRGDAVFYLNRIVSCILTGGMAVAAIHLVRYGNNRRKTSDALLFLVACTFMSG